MDYRRPKNKSVVTAGVVILAVLAITLIVSAIPQSYAAAVTCKWKHKVQQGETLTYIANLYQVGWEKIADANKLTAPYAIVVGQILCIPEGVKPDSTKTSGKAPSLQAFTGINRVLVTVENFAPKAIYHVRIAPSRSNNFFFIGRLKTNKEGDYTGWFHVPYFIPRTAQMNVCVKNVITDRVSCVDYDDIFEEIVMITGKCNPKVGR